MRIVTVRILTRRKAQVKMIHFHLEGGTYNCGRQRERGEAEVGRRRQREEET